MQKGAPLWIEFSVPPKKTDTQSLLTVSSPSGPVDGSLSWKGSRLLFTPVPELARGIRYVLRCEGSVRAEDGRVFEADHTVPFYVETDALPPRLLSWEAGGSTAAVDSPLRLIFSLPMNRRNVERNMIVQPGTPVTWNWNADSTEATLAPKELWEIHTLYRWRIPSQTESLSGLHMQQSRKGTFFTGADDISPSVIRMVPAAEAGDTFLEQTGLGYRDLLLVEFSEEIAPGTLEEAWRIQPGMDGVLTAAAPFTYVFLPDTGWRMNTEYRVTIDSRLSDMAGNTMLTPYTAALVPDIPLQHVTAVTVAWDTGSVVFDDTQFNTFAPLTTGVMDVAGDAGNHVEVSFAEPFEEPRASALAQGVSIHPYFPDSITATPAVESLNWTTPTTLSISFAGYDRPTVAQSQEEKWYYKLTIPGGREATVNQYGSFLEEETWLLMEIPPEE